MPDDMLALPARKTKAALLFIAKLSGMGVCPAATDME
jgi:hypothetical protein